MVASRITSILLLVGSCSALDMQFDKILCDMSLPAYAEDGEMTVTCNDGNKRCSFGDTALISGILHYNDLSYFNSTGYASADLQLMTLEYQLFELLPFNFCGDFIKRSTYNFNTCPANGKYHFEVPYTLPAQDDEVTSWFATGWKGTSYLKINADYDAESELLAHCKLEFETFVTQSQESGWATLPSAAVATLVVVCVVAFLFVVVCCLACKPRTKHVTDDVYENEFKPLEEDYNRRRLNKKNNKQSKLQAQAEKDWLPPGDADWAPETTREKAHRISLQMKPAI